MNAIPMQNIAAMGRHGDTMLAHINAREAKLLELFGGSGTINPKTGLLEFYDDSSEGADNEGGGDTGNGVGGDMGGYEGSIDATTSTPGMSTGPGISGFGIGEEALGTFGRSGTEEAAANAAPAGSTEEGRSIAGAISPGGMRAYDNSMGLFENTMRDIAANLNGIAHGFSKGLGKMGLSFGIRTAGKGIAAAAGLTGTIASLGIGALSGIAGGYIAEHASPPSAETVAANTNPGLSGVGSEPAEGTASTAPGAETASTPTAIPARRAMLQGVVSYPRQRIALTGLPVR